MKITGFRIALLFFLTSSSSLFAFPEDTCFYFDPNFEDRTIIHEPFNCFDVRCREILNTFNEGPQCYVKGISGAGRIPARLHGRSSIHFDAVWLFARILGMSEKSAGTLAAYSQAVDSGVFQHYKGAGGKSGPATEDIYGLSRFSLKTMGGSFHFVPWFNDGSFAGQQHLYFNEIIKRLPPLDRKEVMLRHLRDWAFGRRDDVCHFGLTNKKGKCFKKGQAKLFFQNPVIPGVYPRGSVNISWQEMKACTASRSDKDCKAAAGGQFYERHYAERISGEPEALGIYLHALSDRVSHYLCTNYTEIEPIRGRKNEFRLRNLGPSCHSFNHFSVHRQEFAHEPLSSSTSRVLRFSYLEIRKWFWTVGQKHKQKFRRIDSRPEICHSRDTDCIVEKVSLALSQPTAAGRQAALCKFAWSFNVEWHDGNKDCKYKLISTDPNPPEFPLAWTIVVLLLSFIVTTAFIRRIRN